MRASPVSPSTTACAAAAIAVLGAGCTRWAVSPVYGPRTEVARRLLGAPQVEETSSSNLQGGFETFGESSHGRHYGEGFHVGGLSGSHDSERRTHCIQQAQIDYVQPVSYETHAVHRPYDVAGSILLGVVGLTIVAIASSQYSSDQRFYEMDPSFFAKPSEPTLAYGLGGGAAVGAGIWLLYSLTSLPKGRPPETPPTTRAWTETTYVEATGCGLVPADR